MPMIDYVCPSGDCGFRFEAFHHNSNIPVTCQCPHCQQDSPRETDVAATLRHRPSNAMRFDPILLDRRMECGEWVYSYPGSSTDPVPDGYERVILDSIRASDRHVKGVNEKEQELRTMNILGEKAYWDQRTKERREATRDVIRQKGFSGRLFDAAVKKVDAARDKRYAQLLGRGVEFHHQAFSFDASNRMAHCDESTGWKDRK